ncbi:unnamed protein product [Scytosiphon promiscuus]
MFSGFDNFAEGFKRFSLDALQEDDDRQGDGRNTDTSREERMPVVAEKTSPKELADSAPTTKKLPSPPHEEVSEWDWDEGNATAIVEKNGSSQVGVSTIPHASNLQRLPASANTGGRVSLSAAGMSVTPASPGELEQRSHEELSHVREVSENPQEEEAGTVMAAECEERPREEHTRSEGRAPSGAEGLAASLSPPTSSEDRVPDKTEGPRGFQCCDTCGKAVKSAGDTDVPHAPPSGPASQRNSQICLECQEAAAVPNSASFAKDRRGGTVSTSGGSVAGPNDSIGKDESPEGRDSQHPDDKREICRQSGDESTQEPLEAVVVGTEASAPLVEIVKSPAVNAEGLMAIRQELDRVKNETSVLEGALRDALSEAENLRGMLSTERDSTRKQTEKIASLSDEVNATRMGFQESNAAHQRTAERSHAFEQELHKTRQMVEELRAESTALQGQVNEALEDRQALEGQLRHLQAGLTQGQEAARQEGRQEVERLEARVKELLKDRDRKQAELDLQNARRKETREFARDLESQLAAVERIAQEREVELNKLKDEFLTVKKNTGEATDQKNTWATKYEALERNFKQVRAQSKRAEAELEEARRKTVGLEAEKALLRERVEVEGAERVTVVASVSHERDFLLRQARVDRLEKELSELRSFQEAQATAAAARAQTTGVLEEYRTRAQQALKRANEITSQTASEKKRLQAEMSKLSSEVAQQRPMWEQAKQREQLHHAEIVELKARATSKSAELEGAAMAMATLEARLAEEEEGKRNLHISVMRLEAQGKSLKQELQRQQKALSVAQDNEANLQARLADQEAALQAAESDQRGIPSHERAEVNRDMAKYAPSPLPAVTSLSTGWQEDKHSSRGGTPKSSSATPRSGMGTEAPEAALADRRRSLGESISSLPSDGDSTDPAQGSVGEQLFYVHQLRERMSKEQTEMRSLISELEASRTAADAQAVKQAQLEKQLEAALLDKKRLQDLDSGRNAAINLEYLKNCVVGALRTSEPSEHARLLPVITTILKLSEDEAAVIAKNISTRAQHQGSFGGSLPPTGAGGSSNSGGSGSWWSAK